MRLALIFVTVIHGLVHLLGFATAYSLLTVTELTQPVSRPSGILWLQASLLFLFIAAGMLMKKNWWWMLAIIAVILSQVLITGNWQDAKYGTFPNILILSSALVGFAGWNFYKAYLSDVHEALSSTGSAEMERITEADLQPLPIPVQKYLRYVGVINTPKLRNVKIIFEGEMRGKGKDWFPFRSEQYDTFDPPNRFFFMHGKMKGFDVPGYHAYKDGTATMTIKLFSLFPVVHHAGKEMDMAETVTIFNDMCLMAPASLLDPRMQWEEVDSQSVKASFTHKGVTVSASLLFNETGQLINFISEDRYDISGGSSLRLRFSTPVADYTNINGFNVPSYGEAIWHYPEGEFVYGKFNLRSIEYNVQR